MQLFIKKNKDIYNIILFLYNYFIIIKIKFFINFNKSFL